MHLKDTSTPFNALKTAEQYIQFGIDPSHGLSRRRYGYYSNNTLFDATHFSANGSTGLIDISTSATGTDTARLRSALVGRYISQTLAQPGVGLNIDSSNIEFDANNRLSLTHGTIAVGAGWHAGGSGGYGVGGGQLDDFFGFVFDETGAYAVLISNGQHLGNSPVPQSEWNFNSMDDSDRDNAIFDPSDGYIFNFPYSWYAFGALNCGLIHPWDNQIHICHRFAVERSSLSRPSVSPMVILDNGGTAQSLSVSLGGLEYGLYGSRGADVAEERATETSRLNTSVGTQVTTTDNAVDPSAAPGVPLVAFRRETGVRDLALRADEMVATADNDIYVFAWDEHDPDTALDGTWREPHDVQTSAESHIEVNTSATTYTPTTAVSRGWDKVPVEKKNDPSLQQLATDDRVPIDATRVYTAVHDGAVSTTDFRVRAIEGF